MVKYIDTIKKVTYSNSLKSKVTQTCIFRVSLAKSEQVFLCSIQLNGFNGTDLSWMLSVGRKSFILNNSDIFRFHLLFLNFLEIILDFS